MTLKVLSAAALLAAVCVASPALACQGKNVLLDEQFADDSNWGQLSEGVEISDGSMKITVEKGYVYHVFYQGDSYDKADVCVTINEVSAGDTGAGLMFAASGGDSWYFFEVNPQGVACVVRYNNKTWRAPVPCRQVKINGGDGKSATLRVTLNGPKATAYVNGQKFADFKISPPDGGGLIGLGVNAAQDVDKTTFAFTNLKITDLP